MVAKSKIIKVLSQVIDYLNSKEIIQIQGIRSWTIPANRSLNRRNSLVTKD
ncbi:MAG: hypothetical protein JWN56_2799 [Sphingobacteriales bacterium]|nr:hypothetical protein [Sphingobacteriales bacterium]